MEKKELREKMKEQRRSLTRERLVSNSAAIVRHIEKNEHYISAGFVMLYLSAFKEPDIGALIDTAQKAKKRVAVPVSNTESFTVTVCEIFSNEELIQGAYGIWEPKIIREVSIDKIDLVLVPGLAFDKSGGRLGFGKGYYDRLLENAKAHKIGICHSFQLIDKIPTAEHDVKMNEIITEKGCFCAV